MNLISLQDLADVLAAKVGRAPATVYERLCTAWRNGYIPQRKLTNGRRASTMRESHRYLKKIYKDRNPLKEEGAHDE